MDALMANNRALTSWAATREKEPDYLTFTAEEANSSVALNKSQDVSRLKARLEYRIGKGTWRKYTWNGVNGLVIPLTNMGDSCQFRAEDVNSTFSYSSYYNLWKYEYSIQKSVSLSGSILSLLSKDMKVLRIPEAAFIRLFEGLNNLSGELVLPYVEKIEKDAYEYTFLHSGIKSLKIMEPLNGGYAHVATSSSIESVVIEGSLSHNPSVFLKEAFRSCGKLKSIKVSFSYWDSAGISNWVQYVPKSGDFYCPADLPLIWDDSHIPVGWTAHPEGKDPVPYPG